MSEMAPRTRMLAARRVPTGLVSGLGTRLARQRAAAAARHDTVALVARMLRGPSSRQFTDNLYNFHFYYS
jgi:hypothetical protein